MKNLINSQSKKEIENFIWAKLRTVAWEMASWRALRTVPKRQVGGQCMCDYGEGGLWNQGQTPTEACCWSWGADILVNGFSSILNMHACMLTHFSHVWLFVTLCTIGFWRLCPWDSPGKNTGVGFHALLQGIFLTQGLNLNLLHLLYFRQILYPLSLLGSPILRMGRCKNPDS